MKYYKVTTTEKHTERQNVNGRPQLAAKETTKEEYYASKETASFMAGLQGDVRGVTITELDTETDGKPYTEVLA